MSTGILLQAISVALLGLSLVEIGILAAAPFEKARLSR
jgi:hypothetical protein